MNMIILIVIKLEEGNPVVVDGQREIGNEEDVGDNKTCYRLQLVTQQNNEARSQGKNQGDGRYNPVVQSERTSGVIFQRNCSDG